MRSHDGQNLGEKLVQKALVRNSGKQFVQENSAENSGEVVE